MTVIAAIYRQGEWNLEHRLGHDIVQVNIKQVKLFQRFALEVNIEIYMVLLHVGS